MAGLEFPSGELLLQDLHKLEHVTSRDPDPGHDPRGDHDELLAGVGVLAEMRRPPQRREVEDERVRGVPNGCEVGVDSRLNISGDLNIEPLQRLWLCWLLAHGEQTP